MRLRLLLVCLTALLLANGCSRWGGDVPELPVSEEDQAVTEELSQTSTLEEARAAYANLIGRAKAAEAKVKALEKQAAQERIEKLQAIAWWVASTCLLVGLGCVAAAIFFSVARRLLLAGAIASFGTMALALLMVDLLPYLVWVGAAIGLIGAGGVIWYLWRLKKMDSEHARVGTQALAELHKHDDAKAEGIKSEAALRQEKAGILADVRRQVEPFKAMLARGSL